MRLIDADALAKLLSLEANAYRNNGDYARAEGIGNALWAIAHAPTVSGWVSVKDRLPDSYIHCIGYGCGEYGLLHTGADGWIPTFITHWMPLPEPPKEDEKHG